MIPLRRLTPLYFVAPKRFIDTDFRWEDFDIGRWSEEEYEWENDEWNGLKDYVSTTDDTLGTGLGDCDDYSLVALSYLHETTDDSLSIVGLWSVEWPPAGHAITYNKDTETVYSSGKIIDKTLDEYVDDSPFDIHFSRTVR